MVIALLLITAVIGLFGLYLMHQQKYWQRKGIKTLQHGSPLGNWLQLKSMHHTSTLKAIYDSFKGREPIAGFYVYTRPVAVVLDLELAKSILVKDFHKFSDRGGYHNEKDILTSNIFFWESERWRPLRSKLTSSFTPAKIKSMFPPIKNASLNLKDAFDQCLETNSVINVNELLVLYTVDTIGTCIFGIEMCSLKDHKNECGQIASKITSDTSFSVRWQLFKQCYANLVQPLGVDVKIFPKYVEDFFMGSIKQIILEREKMGIRRNDFVDFLFDLRSSQKAEGKPEITYNEMTAQLFMFFLAGHESAAAAVGFALYELARHPEIQDRLREEIQTVLQENNNELTHEVSMKMPYLDQVISETMRRYPILPFLERTSQEDYKIENTKITLDKGSSVLIPVCSIHYDPEVYESPNEFRPEHFDPAEVAKRHPMSFLGFGAGPRNCIGMRMGQSQMSIALIVLLSNFKFYLCEKSVTNFQFSDHVFNNRCLNDVYLRVEKLKGN
uniref:Cytochrome P450 n=1 Tax=Stomoxys calcitrans TaxID=35570 RepID=A0A1I8PQM7_STOCA